MLSMKIFKRFGKIQFEFFILHQAIIVIFNNYHPRRISGWVMISMVEFVVILFCSTLYRMCLEQRLSKALDKVLIRVHKLVDSE